MFWSSMIYVNHILVYFKINFIGLTKFVVYNLGFNFYFETHNLGLILHTIFLLVWPMI